MKVLRNWVNPGNVDATNIRAIRDIGILSNLLRLSRESVAMIMGLGTTTDITVL